MPNDGNVYSQTTLNIPYFFPWTRTLSLTWFSYLTRYNSSHPWSYGIHHRGTDLCWQAATK
jgi:hypothetical protein